MLIVRYAPANAAVHDIHELHVGIIPRAQRCTLFKIQAYCRIIERLCIYFVYAKVEHMVPAEASRHRMYSSPMDSHVLISK